MLVSLYVPDGLKVIITAGTSTTGTAAFGSILLT